MENLSHLTRADIEARALSDVSKKLNADLPEGLLHAISSEIHSPRPDLEVPEEIFVRDILPAITDKEGNITMTWWRDRFGSMTNGFFVIDSSGNRIFEFPPAAPSISSTTMDKSIPVTRAFKIYGESAINNPHLAKDRLINHVREAVSNTGDLGSFIFNVAQTERICRRYGQTILYTTNEEFVKTIDEAVAGLDEAWGALPKVGEQPAAVVQGTAKLPERTDDDDEAPEAVSFD